MPHDPLPMLARLRRIEVEAARRRMAEAAEALARQRAAAAEAEAALRAETPDAVAPTYGAFLARGLAARHAEAAALAHAEAALEAERGALAAARRAEKVLDLLRERRAAIHRRTATRREQARLEDARPSG
ncbi:flagellar FliJ family protein [Roseomonas sp. HF4]|uniref:flagellar FliJ family protein n=1 Tax=Roseomonas sp. HF4 TaxID=2562313 RepID=UPI0010BF92FA|nr:flagellar FliJ family protein [Roseomonas sp. HF4]